jgi:Ca2+-binding RTX toxin-like protein
MSNHTYKEVQQTMKFLRNKLALWVLAALAVGGVAFLVLAAGANVNCFVPSSGTYTCFSTTGQSSTSTFDATTDLDAGTPGSQTLFTGENDTASIGCPGATATFSSGGGNDVIYLTNLTGVTPANSTVNGEDGDDVIVDGCTSNNTLNGGNGNDVLIEDAQGTLNGDAGNDLLAGGQDDDSLDGGDGNDILVGGPGDDDYNTADNDGNDIVIIHAGDVPAGAEETYSCEGDDIILLFGFNLDLVVTVKPTDDVERYYNLTADPTPGTGNDAVIGDPVNNPTGSPSGARYTFTADNTGATGTCTIIVVE